jgi:hypothetical protein
MIVMSASQFVWQHCLYIYNKLGLRQMALKMAGTCFSENFVNHLPNYNTS